jgi:hypothetical protein
MHMLIFRHAFQQAFVYSELHATHCWSIWIPVAAVILHSKFYMLWVLYLRFVCYIVSVHPLY